MSKTLELHGSEIGTKSSVCWELNTNAARLPFIAFADTGKSGMFINLASAFSQLLKSDLPYQTASFLVAAILKVHWHYVLV